MGNSPPSKSARVALVANVANYCFLSAHCGAVCVVEIGVSKLAAEDNAKYIPTEK
jgi:hypothetical protein